jgi:hypothetical protein
MRTVTLLAITLALSFTACSHATSGTASSNASAKNGGGGGNTPSNQGAQGSAQTKAGSGAATNSANGDAKGAAVPDPHASKSPNVGREAGVGDDPANLETADPQGNGGDSGKPGPAQKP